VLVSGLCVIGLRPGSRTVDWTDSTVHLVGQHYLHYPWCDTQRHPANWRSVKLQRRRQRLFATGWQQIKRDKSRHHCQQTVVSASYRITATARHRYSSVTAVAVCGKRTWSQLHYNVFYIIISRSSQISVSMKKTGKIDDCKKSSKSPWIQSNCYTGSL